MKKGINTKNSVQTILSSPFISVEDAATILKVDKRTVYRLINDQKLTAMKISRRVMLIKTEDLLLMMNRTSSTPHITKQAEEVNKEAEKLVNKLTRRLQNPPRTYGTPSYKTKTTAADFKQSIKGNVVDEKDFDEPFYTLSQVLSKYRYSYSRFYTLRLIYQIRTVKMYSTKCFPVSEVDSAMAMEKEIQGRCRSEQWLTCSDIMNQYGITKTQVRRFAMAYGVRIKKIQRGHVNLYMRSDWEYARKVSSRTLSNKGGTIKALRN